MTMSAPQHEGIGEDEARRAYLEGHEEVLRALGRFNLAIIGDTGVGKSTLVNAIFGDERAKTGIGAPVTQESDYYLNEAGTFGVWDFEGFEHGTKIPPVKSLTKRLKAIQQAGDRREIHVAWFCWDASGARLTDGHRALLQAANDAGIPVIGVLTKAHRRGNTVRSQHAEFARYLEAEDLGFADPSVHLTAATADPDFDVEAFGLEELLHTTVRLAPEATRDAAMQAQIIDYQLKRQLAWKWITAAMASAASVAVVPIPVASALVLAPIQLGMFGKIGAIYGRSVSDIIGAGATFQFALQLTGRAAAQSLVKLVPVAGSVINGTVASTWTGAAGEIWRRRCENLAKGEPGSRTLKEFQQSFGPAVQQLFTSWMTKGRPKELE